MIPIDGGFSLASLVDPAFAPRGVAKYELLRHGLAAAIEDGRLLPGTRLPAELQIAEQTKFSLGTVQRALRELANDGYVERKHGRGTFVAERGRVLAAPIHAQFVEPGSSEPLPVYTRVVDRRIETEPGPWCEILDEPPQELLRLDRRVDIDGRFLVANRTHLPRVPFGRFMDVPTEQLDGRNLRKLMFKMFGLKVVRITQRMRVAPLPEAVAGLMVGEPGMAVLEIGATAYVAGGKAVYHQAIWVPPSEEALLVELAVSA